MEVFFDKLPRRILKVDLFSSAD